MRRIFSKKEVRNILIAEYDYDTDIAVQRKENLMLGIQQGKSLGFAEGESYGFRQKALQDARSLKRLGVSVEIISQATGLSQEEVEALN